MVTAEKESNRQKCTAILWQNIWYLCLPSGIVKKTQVDKNVLMFFFQIFFDQDTELNLLASILS